MVMKRKTMKSVLFCFAVFFSCGASQAQSEYSLYFNLKPNARSFVDITKENVGENFARSYHAFSGINLDLPRFEIGASYKNYFASIQYGSEVSGLRSGDKDYRQGVCDGIVPFIRNFDFWGIGLGRHIRFDKLEFKYQLGTVWQDGRNIYITCDYVSPSDAWHIREIRSFTEWGAFGSLEVNYSFPKKDRERIRKERYVIGLNGIYSHLPNEVDHYAYGLHVGFNFLYKKGQRNWRF